MKRVKFNVSVIFIFIIYLVLLVISNVTFETIPMAVVPGSYAETFAREKHLPTTRITDDMRREMDVRYEGDEIETVRTNLSDETGNYMEITKGDTILHIYEDGRITDGTKTLNVIADQPSPKAAAEELSEEAVSEEAPDSVYLIQKGDTLTNISLESGVSINEIAEANGIDNINLIYAGTEIIIPTKMPVVTIPDPEPTAKASSEPVQQPEVLEEVNYVVSPMSECQYGYNIKNDSAEVVYYYGEDRYLVIPSHIAGYPVTSVAIDLVGNYEAVAIPETVTQITGEVSRALYTPLFFFEIVFSIIAFTLVIIEANILMPRLKNKEEFTLTSPQLIMSYIYLIAQVAFSILSIYYYIIISDTGAVVVSTVLLIVYIVTVSLAGMGRKHAIEDRQKTIVKTSFMQDLKLDTADLAEGIVDSEARKQIERLVEDIRFSGLEMNGDPTEIEAQLKKSVEHLRTLIAVGDAEAIKSACVETKSILEKRNRMAKR